MPPPEPRARIAHIVSKPPPQTAEEAPPHSPLTQFVRSEHLQPVLDSLQTAAENLLGQAEVDRHIPESVQFYAGAARGLQAYARMLVNTREGKEEPNVRSTG